MEREAREREERQAAFASYWQYQLSEQERFQIYCEDKFREPKLTFQGATQSATGEAGSPKNSHDATAEATLSAAEIQKLE